MINNFMIFGDSYSTHRDCIPKEYASFYFTEVSSEQKPNQKMFPNQTWWGKIAENDGSNLVLNDSWSGSTIGYTGYSGDCSKTSSFIYRYEKLLSSGFFADNKIDTVFVFGGTNDSWSNAPLGQEQCSDWKRDDLFRVLPAICYFMNRLKNDLPETKIVFIANCDIKAEIVDCMRNAALRIGVEFVELTSIDKIEGHPTPLGMQQIYEQIMDVLSV